MQKRVKISILFLLVIPLFNCCDDKNLDDGYNGSVDVISMATPNGGKLNPAQSGPERSALGVPAIDLNSFQLEIGGSRGIYS